jgi:hypothetical protein
VRKKPIKTRNFVMVKGGGDIATNNKCSKTITNQTKKFIASGKRKKKNLNICK